MKETVWLVLLTLFAIVGVASAQTYVLKTETTITIDGNLSEWDNSSILAWRSPHSDVDLNYIYLLHSNDYYFIGAKIYDNDGINDDDIKFYLNNTTTLIRFDLNEGSNSVNAYKYNNGSWIPISTNASVVYTRSNPYSVIEMKIPKSEFDYSKNLSLYLEYHSPHIRDVYGWYPANAKFNDTNTWEQVIFIEMMNRTLNLSIYDRNGIPIDYATDDFLLEFRYTANNSKVLTVFGRSHMSILLPPSNITMLVKFLNIPIFEKTYDLTLTNVTDSININNLLKVDSPRGYLVIFVEKNGTLKSVDFDYAKNRAVIVSKSAEVLFDSKLPWSFLAVLYANNYTYNPVTNHLLVSLNSSKDVGFVLVVGDNNTPVLSYASNVVTCFDFEDSVYRFHVKNGTYRLYYSKSPFSIAFNGKALKKGVDYVTGNNTTAVNVASEGLLEVYYEKPVSVTLESVYNNFKVYIATPYSFNGKVKYTVKVNNQTIEDRTINFKANPPISIISFTPTTFGNVEVHVYDTDTNVELYSTTQKVFTNWTVVSITIAIILCAIFVAILVTSTKKSKEKTKVKIEMDWKFFKRLR